MAHAPTDRPTLSLPRRPVLLGIAALLLAGCGLADYEGHMASEAERVQRWEEEKKLLGDPLTMPQLPKVENKEQQNWLVFLRPPLGVSSACATQANSPEAQLLGGLLAQYSGSGTNGIQGVYLGVGGDQKDYIEKVLNQFGKSATELQGVVVTRPTGSVTLKRKIIEDAQSSYSANFYEHGSTAVAVIYRMPKGNMQGSRAIDMSLMTLGEGNEERTLKQTYDKTHLKVKK